NVSAGTWKYWASTPRFGGYKPRLELEYVSRALAIARRLPALALTAGSPIASIGRGAGAGASSDPPTNAIRSARDIVPTWPSPNTTLRASAGVVSGFS